MDCLNIWLLSTVPHPSSPTHALPNHIVWKGRRWWDENCLTTGHAWPLFRGWPHTRRLIPATKHKTLSYIRWPTHQDGQGQACPVWWEISPGGDRTSAPHPEVIWSTRDTQPQPSSPHVHHTPAPTTINRPQWGKRVEQSGIPQVLPKILVGFGLTYKDETILCLKDAALMQLSLLQLHYESLA